MIDIILVIVIAFLLGLLGFVEHEDRKERATLINSVIAKNTQELVNLKLADSTKVVAQKAEQSDLIPTDEITPDQFQTMIEHENRVVEETA